MISVNRGNDFSIHFMLLSLTGTGSLQERTIRLMAIRWSLCVSNSNGAQANRFVSHPSLLRRLLSPSIISESFSMKIFAPVFNSSLQMASARLLSFSASLCTPHILDIPLQKSDRVEIMGKRSGQSVASNVKLFKLLLVSAPLSRFELPVQDLQRLQTFIIASSA